MKSEVDATSHSTISAPTRSGPPYTGASDRWAGVALVALSAAGFASLSIFGKMAYAEGMGLPLILTLRFGFAALLLLVPLFIGRGRAALPPLGLAWKLLALGAFGYSVQATLYFIALQRLPAWLCSMLLYLYPILVALLDWAFNRRAPRPRLWVATGVALSGVVLTIKPQSLFGESLILDGLGLAAVLGSTLWYALYILIVDRVVPSQNALASTAWIAAGAFASFAIAGWVGGTLGSSPSIAGLGILLAMALLSTIVPIFAFLAGLARIGPTAASLISTLEPVFTVLLAMLLLGERLAFIQIAGGLLVLSAVILTSLPSRRNPA